MPLIEWNGSLSVHNEEIDRQHEKLVVLINELHSAMLQGKGNHILQHIMNGLTEYADVHFSTEETYFNRFNYPDKEAHIREHADFTKKLTEFKQTILSGRKGVTIEIIDFLSTWLSNHIMIVDKKYETFFHEHGIS